MAERESTSPMIFVVDPDTSDYAALASLLADRDWTLHFLPAARRALRLDVHLVVDLWIVNVRLPDMSGLDLVALFRQQRDGETVFAVTDQYCREDEVRALSLGVASYLCKPIDPACVRNWRRWDRYSAPKMKSP